MSTFGMSRVAWASAAWVVVLACSSSKDRAPTVTAPHGGSTSVSHGGSSSSGAGGKSSSGSGGKSATGGNGSHTGGRGGSSGGGGAAGDGEPTAGAAGAPVMGECGNGVWEPGEDCDGKEFDNASCESLGFTSGTLACHADCTFDTKACKGTENCFDGRDNDGNGDIDCDDAACAASCASSCSMAQTLADPGEVTGDTQGHAAQIDSSCKDPDANSGSEIVYRVTATKTGVLDLDLATAATGLTLSARTTCATASSERDCSTSNALSIPVTAGDRLFVVVDGYTSSDFGKFTLTAQSREISCGDGIRDAGEGCDDADNTSGDGCSATCQVESTEVEPNDSSAKANAYVPSATDYYYAEIGAPGDVDWLKVEVPTGATTLRATTRDFGDGACGLELLDSDITIYAANGTTLIAENDDNPTADGFCADVTATDLTPGTYYIRVMASPSDPSLTFPYALEVDVK